MLRLLLTTFVLKKELMVQTEYNVKEYWSEVAKRIKIREEKDNVIAGDDEPFYRYKRRRFLDLLLKEDYYDKYVLVLQVYILIRLVLLLIIEMANFLIMVLQNFFQVLEDLVL